MKVPLAISSSVLVQVRNVEDVAQRYAEGVDRFAVDALGRMEGEMQRNGGVAFADLDFGVVVLEDQPRTA